MFLKKESNFLQKLQIISLVAFDFVNSENGKYYFDYFKVINAENAEFMAIQWVL
jgi:hypothetical protein